MANNSCIDRVIRKRPFGWQFINEREVPFHFSFEEVDPFYWHDLLGDYWLCAFYVSFLYIVTIFGLQWWMKGRPAYGLRKPLFWRNLGLGIFSILGFLRTLPGFLYVLRSEGGFYTSICVKKEADIGHPVLLLGPHVHLQQVLGVGGHRLHRAEEEAVDIFAVVPSRHYDDGYVDCGWASPHMEPVTRWYTVLNYGVHGLMCNYFALKAKGFRVPSWVANLITTLQLGQMMVGFGVNILSMYYYYAGHNCARYPPSIKAFGIVYGSFLIIFGKLFYDSVLRNGRKRRENKAPKKID